MVTHFAIWYLLSTLFVPCLFAYDPQDWLSIDKYSLDKPTSTLTLWNTKGLKKVYSKQNRHGATRMPHNVAQTMRMDKHSCPKLLIYIYISLWCHHFDCTNILQHRHQLVLLVHCSCTCYTSKRLFSAHHSLTQVVCIQQIQNQPIQHTKCIFSFSPQSMYKIMRFILQKSIWKGKNQVKELSVWSASGSWGFKFTYYHSHQCVGRQWRHSALSAALRSLQELPGFLNHHLKLTTHP